MSVWREVKEWGREEDRKGEFSSSWQPKRLQKAGSGSHGVPRTAEYG